MESKDVPKNIKDIYEKLRVPKNLQEHMVRAAAAADFICSHYASELPMNKDDIIAVMLLHDVGNIAKMDFSSEFNKKMFANDSKGIGYWAKAKEDILNKYGTRNEHELTTRMCKELNIGDRIVRLIDEKSFSNSESALKSNDWDLWTSAYTDLRIGPNGVVSLNERFDEVRARANTNSSIQNPRSALWIQCAFEMEKKVLERTDLAPEGINDKSVKKYFTKYSKLAGL